jgi:rhodanese-related sulfurtransferase
MQVEAALHDGFRAAAGVTLEEFLSLIDEGAVVIDARPASAFGEAHLAAAQTIVLNVPADEFDVHLPRLRDFAGARFVLYCSSAACDSAAETCLRMADAGFDPADLFIYTPGWEGILAAELETAVGAEFAPRSLPEE